MKKFDGLQINHPVHGDRRGHPAYRLTGLPAYWPPDLPAYPSTFYYIFVN